MASSATLDRTTSPIAPIDVSRAELYEGEAWQEPFRTLRAEAPIQYVPDSDFGPYWSVSTYKPIVQIEAQVSSRCTAPRVDGAEYANAVSRPRRSSWPSTISG